MSFGSERMVSLNSDFEVVIAGGGISGLTAATVSARLGRKTLLLIGDMLGGNLVSIEKIEGYPGFPDGIPGYDLCPLVQAQAAEAGAEFDMTMLDTLAPLPQGWVVSGGEQEYAARAVILATGTTMKELGVPGELDLVGRGVSHCASCDAPLLRDRAVAVVGGGDSALQEALTLAEFASKVIILQQGGDLSAQATFRNRVAAHPRIEINTHVSVLEILGDDAVSGLRYRNTVNGKTGDLEVVGVFLYIGLSPNTKYLFGQMDLDFGGGIPTDSKMRTGLAGVFAAGTVRSNSLGRAVASAGDGATAAIAADKFLSRGIWLNGEMD